MRLNAAETARKSYRATSGRQRLGAGDGVAHIVRSRGQHCVDHIVGKAPDVFQIEVQPLAEEIIQLRSFRILRRCRVQHVRE